MTADRTVIKIGSTIEFEVHAVQVLNAVF